MTHVSDNAARRLLQVLSDRAILNNVHQPVLNALVERGYASAEAVYRTRGERISNRLVYRITVAGRAWLDGSDASIIRKSTKSEQPSAAIALHRWIADIDYRHDDGIRTTMRGLHELAELQDIVEDGPSFYAITGIRIGAPRHCDPVTVEEAARQ